MSGEYQAQTDTKNKIKLESYIVRAEWKSAVAVGGYTAQLEVITTNVGDGATIEIKGKSTKGKAPESLKGTIYGNYFTADLPIPEKVNPEAEVWFDAKLPKHGLKLDSLPIPTRPPIFATMLKWGAANVAREDIVTLQGTFEGCLPNSEADVIVYEYNPDGHHDKIAAFSVELKNLDLEVKWEFDYYDDTAKIPTEHEKQKYDKNYENPRYFFVVVIDGVRIGVKQESGFLKFKDKMGIKFVDESGQCLPNAKYIFTLPDGTKKNGQTDESGIINESQLPPGNIYVEFIDYPNTHFST